MVRLYTMDYLNAIKLLVVLTFVHATRAQTATIVTSPTQATAAKNMSFACTVTGGPVNVIQWIDDSIEPADTIYSGSNRISAEDKYLNFELTSSSASESVMVIVNAEFDDDDGMYRCDISPGTDDTKVIVVEAPSNVTVTLTSIVTNNVDMYVATCDAIGGKPQETLTWTLNGVDQTDGTNGNTIVETNPPATAPLSNTKSVFSFPATLENHGQTLVCQVSGHAIPELNVPTSRDLDIHGAPSADDIMTVGLQFLNTSQEVRVSCNISDEDQPTPRIRNYYIYSDGIQNLIHQSSTGVNFVDVSPGFDFNCVAGNYLGNITTYDPPSTTTLTPTTMAETITPEGNTPTMPGLPTTQPSMPPNTSETATPTPKPPIGPIIGGVVAAIVIIVIIVIAVCYCKTQERFCFEAGGTPAPSNKPSGRAVGSSNGSGSEKDVESPLNGVKDVTAEEKLPQAAPRGHGSIQHTNDNPDQAMYAMVDKKPARGGGGGDVPDTRGSGPGQNEPPGMLYADLDLSHKAGHTDKHVPKNENDVVVYSSILV